MADIPLIYDISLADVQKFKDFGTFTNNFDQYGNDQMVYSVSQSFDGKYNYVAVPLLDLQYNENSIVDTTNVEFTELQTPQTKQTQDVNQILIQYNNLLEENRLLNQTVNDLVVKYENNDDKQVIAALKNTIINLRIQLGQGNVPSDFSDNFPFLPIK